MGTYTYSDGGQYKGQFKKGLLDGKGVLHSDGQVYRGEFKEGEHYGKGTITYFDKSQEIGEWKNGEFVVTQKIKAPKKKKTETPEGEEEPFDDEDIALEDFSNPEQDEDPFGDEDFPEQEDIFTQDDLAAEQAQEDIFLQDDLDAEQEEEDIFSQDNITEETEGAEQ